MSKELKRSLLIIFKRKISLILCLILGLVSAQVYLMLKPPVSKSTLIIALNEKDRDLFNAGPLPDAFWTTDLLSMVKLQWNVWAEIFPQKNGKLSINRFQDNFDMAIDDNRLIVEITADDDQKVVRAQELISQLYTEIKILELDGPVKDKKKSARKRITALNTEIEDIELQKATYLTSNKKIKNEGLYKKKLQKLKSEQKKNKQIYTDKHPKVVKTKKNIAELKRKLAVVAKLKSSTDQYDMQISVKKSALEAATRELEALTNLSIEANLLPEIRMLPVFKSISSNRYHVMTLGALIGLIFGLILSFATENMDTSMESIKDIETYLQIPVLGLIPHIERRVKKIKVLPEIFALRKSDRLGTMRSRLLFCHPKDSLFADAYNRMISKYFLKGLYVQSNTLLFTSSDFNEGKSVTATNVAFACAAMDKKVLLVEADLERPSLNRVFDVPRNPGLTDCVLGNTPWRSIVKKTAEYNMSKIYSEKFINYPGIRNLDLMTFGRILKNNKELFQSPKLPQIINEMKTIYDLVIFDCSPLLKTEEVFMIAKYTQGLIMVYQVGKVNRGLLRKSQGLLKKHKIRVHGVILNDIPLKEYASIMKTDKRGSL